QLRLGDCPLPATLPADALAGPSALLRHLRRADHLPGGRGRYLPEQAVQRPQEGHRRPPRPETEPRQGHHHPPPARHLRLDARRGIAASAGRTQLVHPLRRASAYMSTTTPTDAQVRQAREQLDAQVREVVRWHFSPDTGTPFWLEKAKSFKFDPLKDVK